MPVELTSVTALTCAAAAAALLDWGAGFWGAHSISDALRQSDYSLEPSFQKVPATVHDPADVLHREEEQRLAAEVVAPGVVTQPNFLVFAEKNENVNNTVEDYVHENLPQLIAPGDDHFANCSLIVGAGRSS